MVYWNWGDIIAASIGGLLVGLGTTLQYWLGGRNNGCGGVLDAFSKKWPRDQFEWKYSYFTGMIIVSMVLFWSTGDLRGIKISDEFTLRFFDNEKVLSTIMPWYAFLIGGIFVGVGGRLGRGCTSGHGLNGIPLLHPGSLIAVCLFMVFGMSIASLCFHEDFIRTDPDDGYWGEEYSTFRYWAAVALTILICLVQVYLLITSK